MEHAPKMELLEQLQLFQKIKEQIKFTQHSSGVLINLQKVPENVLEDMYQTVKQYQESRPFLMSGQLHARSASSAPSETIVVNLQPSEPKETSKKMKKVKPSETKSEEASEPKKRRKAQKI